MSAKKNKSSIKYGNYIYNELKDKKKIQDTISDKPKLSFVTLLETIYESIPSSKRISSVISLGGIPIIGSVYNRLNFIFNKQLKINTENIVNSYNEENTIDPEILENYIFLCEAQSSQIKAEEQGKTYSNEELIDFYIDNIGININE